MALVPYIMLRRCGTCSQRDVFLYDSRKNPGQSGVFQLLDFMRGHRLELYPHQAEDIAAELIGLDQPLPVINDGELGADYHDRAIVALLEAKALQARYLRPEYLQRPLKTFLQTHDRGIIWLTVPSHTGKSLFVQGLASENGPDAKNPVLGDGVRVAAFPIRREFKIWPEQFRSFLLEDLVRGLFGRDPAQARLPELDTNSSVRWRPLSN